MVEYGPMELDLNLRVRIFELEQFLAEKVSLEHHRKIPASVEYCACI